MTLLIVDIFELLHWSPEALHIQSIGEFVYFRIIYDFLSDEFRRFGVAMMGRMMGWAGSVSLTLMTLWLLLQGFRIATGSLREPMTTVLLNAARSIIILSTATGMAFMGTPLHDFLTNDMSRLIHYLVTGKDSDVVKSIDEALVYMQFAMSSIDAISVVDTDVELSATKARAIILAGFGVAGPPITAGALLLIYQVAMALFIGLGPLFITSLMFDQTRGMFQRWLFYGIGTLFSLAVLSFVVSLALKLLIAVSTSFWSQKLIGGLIGINLQEGISSQAAQQGGIGLLLTLLILSTPPMAAAFFQGALGHLMHYSAWAGNASIGAGGWPAGSYDGTRNLASSTQGSTVDGGPATASTAPNPGGQQPAHYPSVATSASAAGSAGPTLNDWPDGGFRIPRPVLGAAENSLPASNGADARPGSGSFAAYFDAADSKVPPTARPT